MLNALLLSIASAEEFVLPEMVVTADVLQEEQEPETALAGNRIVLDREVLARSTQNSLSEILEVQAGIPNSSLFGNSDLAVPQLRGFGENAQLRTLLTIDGLSVNRSDLSVPSFSQFPAESLEKVTVFKGGRTVRYGPDALAGVIALETRLPTEGREGSLELTAGSDETFRQRFSLSTAGPNWGLGVQGENFTSDGYRDNSESETTALSVILGTHEADWGNQRITIRASRQFYEAPGALSLADFERNPRSSTQPDQSFENRTISLGHRLQLSLNEKWKLETKGLVSASHREADFQGRLTDGEVFEGSGELVISREGEAVTFEAGVRGRWSQLDFELSQPLGSRREEQDADLWRATFGGFLSSRWQATDRWAFSAGASWDRFLLSGEAGSSTFPTDALLNFDDSASGGEAAFELGVEFQWTESLKVWLRYDRSVRFPVLDEVAFFQGVESPVPFNAGLQPERGQGLELGLEKRSENGWSVQGTFFGQWLEDEIFFDAVAIRNENLSATQRLGAELSAGYDLGWGEAKVFYNATWARFQDGVDEGRRIPLVPRHSASGSFTWHVHENLDLSVEGSYLSERSDGNNRGELAQFVSFRDIPGRLIWNAAASWTPVEDLSFFVRINNVFDEAFISSQFSGAVFPGVGRQVLMGGKIKF